MDSNEVASLVIVEEPSANRAVPDFAEY